jgi:MoaA/NifB/PqqE/SkfB family radical SAM enzyme|tara:strand:+ start:4960 stop:6159 length:1200 start_codon:yes stop_codon:yes gene_type:complete
MSSKDLVAIDFEIASTCNAVCPICIRRKHGQLTEFAQQYTTAKEVKRILSDTVEQLQHIQFCGNYGDPMTNPEILDICEWIRSNNEHVSMRISTNGGIGSPKHYKRLGQLGVHLIWGIDGASKEINALHRVRVDYNKVIRNMDEYISDIKDGTYHEWQYIVWQENAHELEDAVKVAYEKGIKVFYIRRPNGADWGPVHVYDFQGEHTHLLHGPLETDLLDTHWELKTQYPELLQRIQTQNVFVTPVRKAEAVVAPKISGIPFPHNAPYSELLGEGEQALVDSITDQTCFSKNFHKPDDLTENKHYVFIGFDNYVYPCCMIGSNVAQAKGIIFEGGPINSILNKINSVGEKAFSVESNTLKQVLDSGVLNTTYFDNLQDNADAFCKLTCGKCDSNKYKVV